MEHDLVVSVEQCKCALFVRANSAVSAKEDLVGLRIRRPNCAMFGPSHSLRRCGRVWLRNNNVMQRRRRSLCHAKNLSRSATVVSDARFLDSRPCTLCQADKASDVDNSLDSLQQANNSSEARSNGIGWLSTLAVVCCVLLVVGCVVGWLVLKNQFKSPGDTFY
jgi:hypothetical protein